MKCQQRDMYSMFNHLKILVKGFAQTKVKNIKNNLRLGFEATGIDRSMIVRTATTKMEFNRISLLIFVLIKKLNQGRGRP